MTGAQHLAVRPPHVVGASRSPLDTAIVAATRNLRGRQAADGHWFNFHEYRYYCGACQMEWIYSTQDRAFTKVPATAQHRFDPARGLLVEVRRQ